MDHSLFYQITTVLLIAGLVAMITGLLKQPSIIAFIITGLIVGPLGYVSIGHGEVLQGLGEIGLTLLLFMVGLELDVNRVKQLGKIAALTGLGQIVFTTAAGYLISLLLGFSSVESIYIAVALTFSSTIIVVKLLSERREMQSLYARIVVGILVVQDFVAMLILLFLGGTGSSGSLPSLPLWQVIMITVVKALFIFLLLTWLSRKIFPRLLHYLGKSDELLLSFSLAWALGLAAFMSLPIVGFSIEMGGFIAGLALANSQVHFEIAGKVKSIRDFFIIIFFIVFGSQIVFSGASIVWPVIGLTVFVLVIQPLIMMLIMGYLGYKPRTSFFASITLAQVSEFSFILIALGSRLGHISESLMGLIAMVGLITIALSSYLILYVEKFYHILKVHLDIFDFHKKDIENALGESSLKHHIVLVGAHRLGAHLIETLGNSKHPLVVVDFDPEIAERCVQKNILTVCGDITDSYIQEQINIEDAKLIISTIPDLNANLELIDAVRKLTLKKRLKPKLIFAAQSAEDAKHLYAKDIDYALSPHFIGGLHLAKILEEDVKSATLKDLKKHHLQMLEQNI